METNNQEYNPNAIIEENDQQLPPVSFGGGVDFDRIVEVAQKANEPEQKQEEVQEPISKSDEELLSEAEEANKNPYHAMGKDYSNAPNAKERVLGGIPTDSKKDMEMYRALDLFIKVNQRSAARESERYKEDKSFRDRVERMITTEDEDFIAANEELFNQVTLAFSEAGNDSINVNNIALKGRAIDPLEFKKDATNQMLYGDGHIGITTKRLGAGNIEDNLTAFKAAFHGTSVKDVNLIHSGFTLTLNPPTMQDLILLNQILHKEEISFAKDTATLINSNKRSYLLAPMVTFIRQRIIRSSLNVPTNRDIMEYIDIRDYDLILAAIISAMNGDSIFVNYRCANGYKWDDIKNTALCNNEYTLKLDMDKLLFIEKNFLPIEYIKQLNKKDKNTVDVSEVEEYKRKLDERLAPLKTIQVGHAEITFKIPSIQEYLDACLGYIDELRDKVSEANVAENEYDRENILKKMMTLGYGMEIANSIEKMQIIGTNNILKKPSVIATFVSELDTEDSKTIYDAYKKYMEASLVAKICYPKSYCSTCIKERPESIEDLGNGIQELTPINMLGFFYQAISIREI